MDGGAAGGRRALLRELPMIGLEISLIVLMIRERLPYEKRL